MTMLNALSFVVTVSLYAFLKVCVKYAMREAIELGENGKRYAIVYRVLDIILLVFLVGLTAMLFDSTEKETPHKVTTVNGEQVTVIDNITIREIDSMEATALNVTHTETENPIQVAEKVHIFNTTTQEIMHQMYDFIEFDDNDNLVIEIANGTVLDAESGDGVLDNGEYIHYSSNDVLGEYKPLKNGDRFQSVFLYNPSNVWDDIIDVKHIRLSKSETEFYSTTGKVFGMDTIEVCNHIDGKLHLFGYDTEYPIGTEVIVKYNNNGTPDNVEDDIPLKVFDNDNIY